MTEREPVTVVFSWDVRPGREADFEEWAHGITAAATRRPGHLGATWLRPPDQSQRYHTILRFSDADRLGAWLDSAEREQWIRKLDGVAREHRDRTSGMETWFSLPGQLGASPPKTRMVAVTLLAVYPLSLLFQWLVAPLTQTWPLPLRAFAFPLIMVPLLTYVVMPGMSRLFRRWLYGH